MLGCDILKLSLLARSPALFAKIWNKVHAAIQEKEQYKHLIAKMLNWGKYYENSFVIKNLKTNKKTQKNKAV